MSLATGDAVRTRLLPGECCRRRCDFRHVLRRAPPSHDRTPRVSGVPVWRTLGRRWPCAPRPVLAQPVCAGLQPRDGWPPPTRAHAQAASRRTRRYASGARVTLAKPLQRTTRGGKPAWGAASLPGANLSTLKAGGVTRGGEGSRLGLGPAQPPDRGLHRGERREAGPGSSHPPVRGAVLLLFYPPAPSERDGAAGGATALPADALAAGRVDAVPAHPLDVQLRQPMGGRPDPFGRCVPRDDQVGGFVNHHVYNRIALFDWRLHFRRCPLPAWVHFRSAYMGTVVETTYRLDSGPDQHGITVTPVAEP